MEWLPGPGSCHAADGKLQEMGAGIAVSCLCMPDYMDLLI